MALTKVASTVMNDHIELIRANHHYLPLRLTYQLKRSKSVLKMSILLFFLFSFFYLERAKRSLQVVDISRFKEVL